MKIKEIIQGFRDVIADSHSTVSDDTSFSDRLLYHYLKMIRAQLLYEKFVKGTRPINKFSTQNLECIPLYELDENECPCRPARGCLFLRSKDPLPQTILITDVRAGLEEFNYIKWEDLESVKHSRFKFDRDETYYSLKTKKEGTYLYIHYRQYLEYADVEGMFEDPLEVRLYPSCCDPDKCIYAPEERFPIDSSLINLLYRMTFETYVQIKSAAVPDILNNDSDETSGAQPPLK